MISRILEYESGCLTLQDCTYVISSVWNLEGAEVSIPPHCVLSFEGGKIKNGVLVGSDTLIVASPSAHIFEEVSLKGTWAGREGFAEWFGARGDGSFDDAPALNAIFSSPLRRVCLQNKTYWVGSQKPGSNHVGLEVSVPKQITGLSNYNTGTRIKSRENVSLDVLLLISCSCVELSNVRIEGTKDVRDLVATHTENTDYGFVSKLHFRDVLLSMCSGTCLKLATFLSTLKRVSCAFCHTTGGAGTTAWVVNSKGILISRCLLRKPDGRMSDKFLQSQNCVISHSTVDFA